MRRDNERLTDIRDAARAALRFVDGRSQADLSSDEMLAAALIQKITLVPRVPFEHRVCLGKG